MAAVEGVTKLDLVSWISTTVEHENLKDSEIILSGKTEKGEGYMGDIVFAQVVGRNEEDNVKKVFDLVIKHGKSGDYLRKVTPTRAAFQAEIHFYDYVIPEFKKFQSQKHSKDSFDSFPKCYKTFMFEKMEVIVLENLKQAGYELHDKKQPMNLNHLKKVLTEYGKFHALSFALKDQEPEKFASMADDFPDILKEFMKDMKKVMKDVTDNIQVMLMEKNEFSLLNKFRSILTKEPIDILIDLLNEEDDEMVIIHGDCWNNNFMFKYEGDDRKSPSKVAFLDFQLSTLRSPAFDLAYFLYSTTCKEQLDSFHELMDIYYSSFSSFLKSLGSDPEKLFPFSTLKAHWRKYSLFYVIFIQSMLKFALCTREDAPAMEDLQEGDSVASIAEINLDEASQDLYHERIRAILNHYFECTF